MTSFQDNLRQIIEKSRYNQRRAAELIADEFAVSDYRNVRVEPVQLDDPLSGVEFIAYAESDKGPRRAHLVVDSDHSFKVSSSGIHAGEWTGDDIADLARSLGERFHPYESTEASRPR